MNRPPFGAGIYHRCRSLLCVFAATTACFPQFLPAEDEFELVRGNLPPLAAEGWTVVVIPDTQGYTSLRKGREANIKVLDGAFEWMAENGNARNIRAVVHVGDMTSKNQPEEWRKIRNCYNRIDGIIPYVVCLGNHDEKPTRRDARIDEYFQVGQNPLNRDFLKGSFEDGKLANAYYTIEANGQSFLFLALEFAPRDPVVAWADGIVKQHPQHHVFITVREYISETSRMRRQDGLPVPEEADKEMYLERFKEAPGINFGVDLKKKLIDANPNVEFLVCGHYGCQTLNEAGELVYDKQALATAHRSDPRDNGCTFHAVLFNAQWIRTGGDGWLLLMEFGPDNRTVQVRTYSPYLKSRRTGSEYEYVLERAVHGIPDRALSPGRRNGPRTQSGGTGTLD